MGFRFKEKKDIKTFILYLLMQIDRPVDIATLNDIVMQDDFVNQFEFMDALFELVASGAVTKDDSSGKTEYSLSTKGRVAAEMLEGDQKDLADSFGELKTYETYNIAFNDLKAGAIDAIAIDMTTGAYLVSTAS